MPTQTQLRVELQRFGLSESQSKKALKRFLRGRDFVEVAALFRGDPTGLCATLRSMGYDVQPRHSKVAA